eukprot:Protomagalhaensia_sp_Gyna_25__4680@NODE_445_length_3413_cov_118_820391_g342_i0_p2_GENE_NODE_445_length_3413_cov_118_820391_g342_i0NODE_445_length_3413_cov_118_820391_g342_i0_p2_ORF_typecomplete_len383_score77_72ParA/PF10609_9/1_5e84AAA_31/PF13614_6/1_4e16CBP_BcsQ/PF06564_12/6_7e15MipZ/PF09140_11/8_3e12CbiA/PF01656_23/3_5e12ArsA_ATPase/PF02374_15/2_3e08ArsA_ATPase/PF02374_15/1_4e03ArsA_ATPase/PF02374_15/3_2VirC1/PF07015_11/9e08VirC1/PF07015_11/8_5Fer4_NifH/PF00142_18/0_00035Fer4_NifH/PF00142_18/1
MVAWSGLNKPLVASLLGTFVGLTIASIAVYLNSDRIRRQQSSLQEGTTDIIGFAANSKEGGDVPENAPHGCPGIQSEGAGKTDACEGCPNRALCSSGVAAKNSPQLDEIATKMKNVKHRILVLSGKGGVGKSTVATQMAWELHSRGKSVGLLDIDICGPSIPRMTGTLGSDVRSYGEGWLPVSIDGRFCVMSIGYLLPNNDDAVIWRGPKKNGLIRQFLTDVYWNDLDYLIIDTPPGTSDEHLSIVSMLQEVGVTGAIVVTTPQEISLQDVRKELNFCKQTHIPVLGLVENMAGSVFATLDPDGAKNTAEKMEVPFAGRISLSPEVLAACEHGEMIPKDTDSSKQLKTVLDACLAHISEEPTCMVPADIE